MSISTQDCLDAVKAAWPSGIKVKVTSPGNSPARIAKLVMAELARRAVGTRCSKCNEDFPYAEARPNFVCYSCKVEM